MNDHHFPTPNETLIAEQLPKWVNHATPEQWQALGQSHRLEAYEQDWFNNAVPDLRETVMTSHKRLLHSQAKLAHSLKGLKQIAEFAEPKLQARLAEHGFTAPLHTSELLRVERSWSWGALRYLYSHRRDNLLQAALQNFANDETFITESAIANRDAIQVTPIKVQGTAATGPQTPPVHFTLASERYKVERLDLAPEAFARLCRQLDLGGAYQAHLQQCFNAPSVREQAIAVQQDRLRLAADLAYLRHELSGAARDRIDLLLNDSSVPCWQLALFGLVLHEVMLIETGTGGLLLYLPGDTPALHACTDLHAVNHVLAALLLEPDNRQRFLAFLSQPDQPHFLSLLQQNLDTADLHPSMHSITAEPFGFSQDQHVARLKSEAEQLAVPTAVADAQARAKRLDEWENLFSPSLH